MSYDNQINSAFQDAEAEAETLGQARVDIQAELEDSVRVVIRWFPLLGKWSICHARSYQNAFECDVNKFKTRIDAVKFAKERGCVVAEYGFDALQDLREIE